MLCTVDVPQCLLQEGIFVLPILADRMLYKKSRRIHRLRQADLPVTVFGTYKLEGLVLRKRDTVLVHVGGLV